MKWQILILTQPSREEFLSQLLNELHIQLTHFAIANNLTEWPAETIVRFWDKRLTLGENRNRLRSRATAEYVSFFDDDDWPASDYISRILPLLDGIDYVGYQVQCYCQHMQYCKYGLTFHSLEFHDWSRVGMGFFRDISHINPMRRELAIQADFEGGFGEDARWAKALREKGIVKTQHYIPEVMYHYIWRAVKNDTKDAHASERLKIIERVRSGVEDHAIMCGPSLPPDRVEPIG